MNKLLIKVFSKRYVLFALLFLFQPVMFAAENRTLMEQLSVRPPDEIMPYWEYYVSLKRPQDVNTAYVKINRALDSERRHILNDLAYIKCVAEQSVLQKSARMLQQMKANVLKEDNYIKGVYYLVYARLLFRIDRREEAVFMNEKAIRFLRKTNKTAELKNALLNHGYFYSATDPREAMRQYDLARKLEKKGELSFYVLLRTNLALQYLLAGKPDSALNYCDEASRFLEQAIHYDYLDEFRVLIIYASISEIKEDFRSEDFYLEKARQLSLKHNMFLNLKSINHSQSVNFAREGDYKSAYNRMREMDSLDRALGIESLSESVVVNDLEQKINKEKNARRKTMESLNLKQLQQQFLTVFIALLLGITVLILRMWNRIRRKNRILLEQNMKLARTEEQRTRPETELKDNHLALIVELEQLMYDGNLYEQANLTIDRLAKLLNTNRTYLSEAINLHYKMSYSNWINEIRINASRKMLASVEFDQYSIEGIAKMVGYTSISSFNVSFKKITGLTPSQFKKLRFLVEYQLN